MNGRNLKDLEANSSLQFKDQPLKDRLLATGIATVNPPSSATGFEEEALLIGRSHRCIDLLFSCAILCEVFCSILFL